MKNKLYLFLFGLVLSSIIFYGCFKTETNEDVLLQEIELPAITDFESTFIDGQYIVIFTDDAFGRGDDINASNYKQLQYDYGKKMTEILEEIGLKNKELKQIFIKVYKGTALDLSDNEVELLKRDDRIELIEQEQTYSVIMGGPPGGGGGSPTQSTPWGITRVGGALDGTGAGKAWIIDSGIDLDHEDLNVDVANSATFLGGNSTPDDQNGHGTHVAGTVAAVNNSVGVVGVAAGAEVVSVRVLDRRGSGSTSGVIAGVDYVAANAGNNDVANMSLGGGASTSLDNAVLAASSSCPFSLAAGNESTNAATRSPARVNGPNVYTVSSMSQGDNWSSFSNYGNPPVDYCAPGSSIYSTYKSGGYATLSGTSMAAPHVAGILLMGNVSTSGYVNNDPDGNADPIASH